MVVHVMRFTFKDEATETERDEVLDGLRRLFAIDAVSFSTLGQDIGNPSDGFTHAFVVGLANLEDFKRYLYEPGHHELAVLLLTRVSKIGSVDFTDDMTPGAGDGVRAIQHAWVERDPRIIELASQFVEV